MPVEEYLFDDRDSLYQALSGHLQQRLQADLEQAETVSCLLSGGSSPAPVYQQLAQTDLPWNRIYAALVDERWVNPDQAGSNEAMLRTTLKQQAAADVQIQGMKNTAPLPASGLEACEHAYHQLPKPWSFALLGMGTDGHTASLFPYSYGLQAALSEQRLCFAIKAEKSPVTGDLLDRMSLGLWALQQCREVILLITGKQKLGVYRQARKILQQHSMPVACVLQHPDLKTKVYWSP